MHDDHRHDWLSSSLTASCLPFVIIQVALQLTSKLLREQRQQLDIFSRYVFLLAWGKRWQFQSRALLYLDFIAIFWFFGCVKFVGGFLEWTSDIADWLCTYLCNILGLFAAWQLSRTCSTYFWMRADRVMETLFFRRWRLSSQNCRARFSVMPDRICSSIGIKSCLCFTYGFVVKTLVPGEPYSRMAGKYGP